MGARMYLPALGQFTAVDPVMGGNANPYSYPFDPVNGSDLTGNCWEICHAWPATKRFVKKS
jgi:RHS repeat-associated protein